MKECKQCGTQFAPARPLQSVCSPICASRIVRVAKKEKTAQKAAERKQIKARKEAIKTIPQLIKEVQVVFNRYIRWRDRHQPCISCGAPSPDLSGLHAGRDAGHWRSTGSAAHLRFTEDNCHAQCVKCNQWGAGRAVEYRIGLLGRIGEARILALETNNEIRKWSKDELRELKAYYAKRLRDEQKNVSPNQ